MIKKISDTIFHPPVGNSFPGLMDQNPYIYFPPNDIRKLIDKEVDEEKLEQMKSALRQWERIYQYPRCPWKKLSDRIRYVAAKIAEKSDPPINVQDYQYYDSEVPEGYEGILESLQGLYDNQDNIRFDISRQGERPYRELDNGDFSSPKDPLVDAVKPRGDGADPEGMDNPFPPTGGDIGAWPDSI